MGFNFYIRLMLYTYIGIYTYLRKVVVAIKREQEDWQQESWHQQQDWYADDGWSQNYWEPDYAYYHYAPKGKYQGKGKWKYGGGGKKGW